MKRTTSLPVYKTPQPFSQPDGIETVTIDDLTNLVALADPGLTRSEVFIAGTEPFPPVQEEPAGIALGPPSQPVTPLGGKGLLMPVDKVAPTYDTQGQKDYINTGALLYTSPSQGSRPLAPTPPPKPRRLDLSIKRGATAGSGSLVPCGQRGSAVA